MLVCDQKKKKQYSEKTSVIEDSTTITNYDFESGNETIGCRPCQLKTSSLTIASTLLPVCEIYNFMYMYHQETGFCMSILFSVAAD